VEWFEERIAPQEEDAMAHVGARLEPEPGDLTPASGSATDVAPLGRDTAKPPHERTADEDMDSAAWDQVAAMDEFRALIAAKARFIVPATIFFLIYYLLLPLLVGYAKDFMDTKVIGEINLAYLFALSQFFVAWILAWLYLRQAGVFDTMSQNIVAKLKTMRGGK
jgi:uncharacterized membrane protein (DUF485 family)